MKKYVVFFSLFLALSAQGMDWKNRWQNFKNNVKNVFKDNTKEQLVFVEKIIVSPNLQKRASLANQYVHNIVDNLPTYLGFLQIYDQELEKIKKDDYKPNEMVHILRTTCRNLNYNYRENLGKSVGVYSGRITNGDYWSGREGYVLTSGEYFSMDGSEETYTDVSKAPCYLIGGKKRVCVNHKCKDEDYVLDEKTKVDTCTRCAQDMQKFIRKQMQGLEDFSSYAKYKYKKVSEQLSELEKEQEDS